ncbi:MAG: metallophosphoesterase [Geminicoccaceae bacterium]
MYEIAHLTDLHIGPMHKLPLRAYFSKRFFGWLSWRRKRHAMHRVEVLESLLDDLAEHPADHVAITGDMVNISLQLEFENAARWLGRFGTPDNASLVPGNHDAYVDGPYRDHWELWRRYMADDGSEQISFPWVRRRGRIAFVGLSSAVPSPIAFAYGRLGEDQLAALEPVLRTLVDEELFTVILVHHPPLARIHSRRNLRDHAALADVIRRCGGDLVLSGHQHRLELGSIATQRGPVPVVVTPSASMDHPSHPEDGGYMRVRIDPDARRIGLRLRRYSAATRRFDTAMQGELVSRDGETQLVQGDWPDTVD